METQSVCHAAPLAWHGGQIAEAARLYPDAPRPWLDLSTGIAPWSYPVERIAEQSWRRLPQPHELAGLEDAAAECFGLSNSGQIVAVPGSDIAIRLLGQALPAARTAIVGHGFGAYRAVWPEARVLPFDQASKADLLICANPNNPDGAVIEQRKLQRLRCSRIVDEAFADACPEHSLLPRRNKAIVLRSFGKFFGLAGVRLGFVVADRPFITQFRTLLGDWPLSGPAIAIGTRAYRDVPWQQAQRERLRAASARLARLLTERGLADLGGTANFRLAGSDDAAGLFEQLCRSGILVRPFADRPEALRFGLPGPEDEWDRLETALSQWSAQ